MGLRHHLYTALHPHRAEPRELPVLPAPHPIEADTSPPSLPLVRVSGRERDFFTIDDSGERRSRIVGADHVADIRRRRGET